MPYLIVPYLLSVPQEQRVELGLTSELLTWRMRRVFDIQDSFMYVLVYSGLLLEIVLLSSYHAVATVSFKFTSDANHNIFTS